MRRAVFLDRDGVLNRERGEHTWLLEHFEVLPGVPEVLKLLQDDGFLLIVITNQSGIGKGLYGHSDVERVHGYLRHMLADQGVQLTDVFHCPHHPDNGKCLCRKPGSLLIEKAIARYGIDPRSSFMIGDRDRDIDAARSVGVMGIKVESNEALLPIATNRILTG